MKYPKKICASVEKKIVVTNQCVNEKSENK